MTQSARGTGQRPEPPTETRQRDSQPSEISQSRPAMRFYEPPPLGSAAFIHPTVAAAAGRRSLSMRQLVVLCVLGAAAGTAAGLILLSTVLDPKPSPKRVEHAPRAVSASQLLTAGDEVEDPAAAATADEPDPVDHPSEAEPAPSATEEEDEIAEDEDAPADDEATEPEARESRRARKGRSSRARAKRDSAKLAEAPTRPEVIAAMARVQPAVKACLAGRHAVVTADMKVVGKTGRITTAKITGQAGPAGSCIARAVRQAKFPPFKAGSVSIRYPMAL